MNMNARAAIAVSVGILLAAEARSENGRESDRGFADHLYAQQDYYRAITEYERFVFEQPSNALVSKAELMIAMSYYQGGKLEVAATKFGELKDRYPGQDAGKDAMFMLAETYVRLERYNPAEALFSDYARMYPEDPLADRARMKDGVCLLRFGNPAWARESFLSVSTNSAARGQAEDLASLAGQYDEMPRKSPLLAAGMSAVLPGGGQMYSGRPHDAMMSFLINGFLIWAAAEAFDRDEDVAGTFIAVFESGWYFGNIYNAANGARKFNDLQKASFFDSLKVKCDLLADPGEVGGVAPGLGLGIRF